MRSARWRARRVTALIAAALSPPGVLAGGLGFDGLALGHGQSRDGAARVTTVGGWSHFHGGYGGLDISVTEGDRRGNTLALAMGVQGLLTVGRQAPFLGYGVQLGYNADAGLEAAMYPELGLRLDLSDGHMLLVQARYYVGSGGRHSDYASYGATLRWAWR